MSIKINNEKYYSLTEAAKRIGVSRMTVYRWIKRGIKIDGQKLNVVRDRTSGQLYLAEGSVTELLPENRFEQVS